MILSFLNETRNEIRDEIQALAVEVTELDGVRREELVAQIDRLGLLLEVNRVLGCEPIYNIVAACVQHANHERHTNRLAVTELQARLKELKVAYRDISRAISYLEVNG